MAWATAARKTVKASLSSMATLRAFSEASLATVRMVPSVGFITALYAAVTPSTNASARSAPLASLFPCKPLEIPRNSRERITPELPLAPRSRAEAATLEVSETAGSLSISSSRAAAPMVMDILVPVSPSGTGKTFNSSTDCFWLARVYAAERIASRSRLPLITTAALLLLA